MTERVNPKNRKGPGTTPEAAYQRQLRANYQETKHDTQMPTITQGGICPTCGTRRTTDETLRVHWELAHNQ